MNDVFKKRLLVGIVIGCLVLAMGITFKSNSKVGSVGKIKMLCSNSKCGHVFELSEKEVKELVNSQNGGLIPLETPVFKCSKCNQKSAYIARECKKCGKIFVPNYQKPDYDKCPKCGYSESQQKP